MTETLFRELVEVGEDLEKTKRRLEIARLIAEYLKGLSPEEIGPAARLLIGQIFPEWDSRALNMSWQAVSQVLETLAEAGEQDWERAWGEAVDTGQVVQRLLERHRREPQRPPPLTLLEVYRTFEAIAQASGPGSRRRKAELLHSLLAQADPLEAKYIVKNVVQEMRHGASEGMLLDAVARAAGVKRDLVLRANMLSGDLGEVATLALTQGASSLQALQPRLFRPLKPMLAQVAESIEEALREHGGQSVLEYKLDGARVQIHKQGDEVRIYSRHLSEVTQSLPEIVELVRTGLQAQTAIVEGEVIAVDVQGRPLPFQDLMRRFRRIHDLTETMQQVPIQLYLFDALYRGSRSLVDEAYEVRWRVLEELAGKLDTVRRLTPRDASEANHFAQQAERDGHEGVIAKSLASRYSPGVRGKAWFKIKAVISLDLVIVAADWGYGRRHGWLSNYHLAARDEDTGEFLEVGKTFKGLTDREFEEMTQRLLALETHRSGGTVFVEPQTVVEVLFNEIQKSPHYPSGLALRFARIARLREDKAPQEADTIQTLRQIYAKQFEKKGMLEEAAQWR